MPYTPIDDTNSDWQTYSQQRGRFDGAADALSQSQLTTPETPVFDLSKAKFVITGTISLNENQRLYVDGIEILPDESQKIRNHSPDGFAWGYAGSGPAQSALAICLHIFKNKYVAEALYQDFKSAFVAHWQHRAPFRKEIDVANFLAEHEERLNVGLERELLDRELIKLEMKETELVTPADAAVEQQMRDTLNQIRADQPQPLRFWHIGDLVTITHPDNNGVKALVYEVYDRSNDDYGISLITEEGRNLGGWESPMWSYLEFDYETGLIYDFVSVGQLAHDYQRGLFKPYFEIF